MGLLDSVTGGGGGGLGGVLGGGIGGTIAGPMGAVLGSTIGGGGSIANSVLGGGVLGPTFNPRAGMSYNAQAPAAPTSNIQNPFTAQDLQNQMKQNQALQTQLQTMAQGGGPNPAIAQLSQATGNNIRNQAALMNSQRGASQNMGQSARNAADIGTMAQNQAGSQAAILRQQQQMGAIGALQGQQGMIGQQMMNPIEQQNAILAQQASMGTQGQIEAMRANAAIAASNAQTQGQMVGGLLSGAGSSLPMIFGARGGMIPHYAGGGLAQQEFGDILPPPAQKSGGMDPSMIAKLAPMAMAANKGGQVRNYAQGAYVDPYAPMLNQQAKTSALSSFGQAMSGQGKGMAPSPYQGGYELGAAPGQIAQSQRNRQNAADEKEMYASLDDAPDTSGGGGNKPMAMIADNKAHGGNVGSKLKSGGHVPGKAKIKGDSLKNDTVHAKLSPGEIVIPRSVINSKDPVKNSAKFVAAILARKGR